MSANPLLLPLSAALPDGSAFAVVNALMALATSIALVALLLLKRVEPWRPAMVTAALLHAFFQWPLALFAALIAAGLQDPWRMAIAVHSVPLCLVSWAVVSQRWSEPSGRAAREDVELGDFVAAFTAVVGASLVYLLYVPFRCTSLFAIIFDPSMTLLAREFSIKLQGTSLGTLAFGAAANAFVPAAFALGAALAWRLARQKRLGLVALLGSSLLAMIAVVLLPGAKGNLVYTAAIATVAFWFWSRGKARLLALAVPSMLLYVGLLVFEVAKDLQLWEGGYDFVSCVKRNDTCGEATKLVQSLYHRNLSLGLQRQQVDKIATELEAACAAGQQAPPPLPTAAAAATTSGAATLDAQSSPATSPAPTADAAELPPVLDKKREEIEHAPSPEKLRSVAGVRKLLRDYAGSILYRAFVVPVQVASWHFLYVESHPGPGLKALPFARRLVGESIDMPALVYATYGSIYSGGDRTYGSTAPTSFVLAYPAYWGWSGLLVVLILLVGFDFAYRRLLRLAHPAVSPVALGLIVVTCLNFMTSDFFTVMISHGGGAAVGLLALLAVARRFRGSGPSS